MKHLFCLSLLPFLLASEVKHIICPDGYQCPFGKTCCNLPTSGNYGCCDIPKEDLEKTHLTLALPSSSAFNVSMASPKHSRAYCSGTKCGIYCHESSKEGFCCGNGIFLCKIGTNWCSDQESEEYWCCLKEQNCGNKFDQCQRSTYNGTICGKYWYKDLYQGVCCDTDAHACPRDSICCKNEHFEEPWCCGKDDGCSDEYGYCLPLNTCNGTLCGAYCFQNAYDAICCDDKGLACRRDGKCCSNQISEEGWCCGSDDGCHSEYGHCLESIVYTCNGTFCGDLHCIENLYDAVCCENGIHACPTGNICCTNKDSDEYWCCPNEKRCGNKLDDCQPQTCNGTKCGDHCLENLYDAVCCKNQINGCPKDTQCCSRNEADEPWCCSVKQRCSSTVNECLNAASSTSMAILSVLFAFLLGVILKCSL